MKLLSHGLRRINTARPTSSSGSRVVQNGAQLPVDRAKRAGLILARRFHPGHRDGATSNIVNLKAHDGMAFYRYTSGRWLWNEEEQFARRYVEFDIKELAQIACQSIGAASCVEIEKLPEGNFNKALLLTVNDGRQVIAKIPNPNAGRPFFNTASEVATMDFARNVLGIPTPLVYAWDANSMNPVGAEYIIMEKVFGVELEKVWDNLTGKDKYKVAKQIADYEVAFSSTAFSSYGSLYYAADLPESPRENLLQNSNGANQPSLRRFTIGPTNNRMFFDDGRDSLDINRGPWRTIEEYFLAIANREVEAIHHIKSAPRTQGLFNGPRQYKTSAASKLSVLRNYQKVAPFIMPKDASMQSSVMWHGDLHSENIFVNPNNPTEIIGVIDWQSIHLSPLCLQARRPALIEFDGPIPEGLSKISLPKDFETMDETQKNSALKLRSAQCLYKLHEIEWRQRNKEAFRALSSRHTLPNQINGLIGSIFCDGEPVVSGMLMALEDEWTSIVGLSSDGQSTVPFPLTFSEDEKAAQKADQELWESGVELMHVVLDELGVYTGWDGWVSHNDYEEMTSRLKDCLKRFLEREALTPEEREAWIDAWPFKNPSS